MAVLILGITRGEKRAARILRAIGERIPGVGGDRLEQIALQAAASIRDLGTNREVLIWSLTWAALNWLLDAASLWCFIAAFGGHANPVGLFAAYGIANVIGAIPITPGGLGIIDTITPVLLIGFGLTRSVATLGVLAWRLVNFWLPIPTGALAYVSLKVPRGAGLGAMRRALSDLIPKGHARPSAAPRRTIRPTPMNTRMARRPALGPRPPMVRPPLPMMRPPTAGTRGADRRYGLFSPALPGSGTAASQPASRPTPSRRPVRRHHAGRRKRDP